MLEQKFRPYFQKTFFDPIVKSIQYKVSPLFITWMSGVFGLIFIPFLLWNNTIIALFLLLTSGILDILDGSLARFQKTSSNFGSAMDIVMDRVVEFSTVFALYLVDPQHRAFCTILMLGSMLICITSFLVVGIFTQNESHKSFHYSPGLMERAEAFIFFFVMVLFPEYFNLLASVFCILVVLTAGVRLKEFSKNSFRS